MAHITSEYQTEHSTMVGARAIFFKTEYMDKKSWGMNWVSVHVFHSSDVQYFYYSIHNVQ